MTREALTPPIWSLPITTERDRGLNRSEIVRAAIAIADAGGAEAVTMRAIATRLGSSAPMSLYRYVYNKDGLVDLMLDTAAAEIWTPTESGVDWRDDLTCVASSMWEMVKRHSWYAQLVHTRPPAGPNACRVHEFVLATFTKLGVSLQIASNFYLLINRHTIGIALQFSESNHVKDQAAPSTEEEMRESARTWWGDMGTDGPYPHLQQLMREFLDGQDAHDAWAGPDMQFELGLQCLLDGIADRIDGIE